MTQNVIDSEIPLGKHTVDLYILGRDVHAILSREELAASNRVCLLQAIHDNSQFVRPNLCNFGYVRKLFCQVFANLNNVQRLFYWPEEDNVGTFRVIWVSFYPFFWYPLYRAR